MAEMVYAFRIVADGTDHWYGNPEALPVGHYQTSRFAFDPGTNPSPFAGEELELRHGDVADDGQPPDQRAFIQLGENPRRVPLTAAVQAKLFPGHGHS